MLLVLHVFPFRPPPKWNYSLAQRYQRMKTLQDHRYSAFSVYRVFSPSVSESASASHPLRPLCCLCCMFSYLAHFYLPAQQHQCRHLEIIARHSLCIIAVAVFSGPSLVRSSSPSLLHPAVSLYVHLPFLWAYLRPSCLDDCAYLGRRFHTSPVLC